MHEIGLVESFLDAVERRAAGRRVTEVRVRIGALHHVVGPALVQAFALVSEGTVAEGASIDLVTVPVRVSCQACGRQWKSTEMVAVCPSCGTPGPDLSGGDELILESIRVTNVFGRGGGVSRVSGDPG
jgi:hydrogenase nickel incorporation protein HypA/HybF